MPNMSDILNLLNIEQKKAVEHDEGPAIVLAGAGSGKTTVLTSRAAWLIEQKYISPESILLVTFTNKAAGEMRQRIEKLTTQHLPFVGTFHSFCARFLRKHSDLVGLESPFSIYDTDDQLSTLKIIYREHSLDPKQLNYCSVLSQISNAKNELLTPSDFSASHGGYQQEQISQIYAWYQHKLKNSNAVDFDDLLFYTVMILQNHSDVLQQYQQQFHSVLVDEYQDTNKVQYVLTKLLAAPQNNLFVVGDFSQSIYGWRGADYRNMLRLLDDFQSVKEFRLEQNYRSHQSILDAATQVIAANRLHPVLSLWTEKKEKVPLTLKATRSDSEEASQVARWILQESSTTPLHEMAILYRTNAQSRAFEEQFLAAGIPYQIVGGTKFYDRKEIKDILSYTQLFINPRDTISLQRAEKVGKRKYQAFQKWQTTENNQNPNSIPPIDVLKGVLKCTEYAKQYDANVPEDVSRLENIAELLRVATKFETMADFLENIALIQDGYMHTSQSSNVSKGVQMMSLHSAKGLEFSIVFLVGVEEGLLPHSRSLMSPEDLEEERRLCYVGITRAKQKLYFSYATIRYSFGSTAQNLPSRFLKDIAPTLFSKDSSSVFQAPNSKQRRLVSDDFLDQILSGALDADSFIE